MSEDEWLAMLALPLLMFAVLMQFQLVGCNPHEEDMVYPKHLPSEPVELAATQRLRVVIAAWQKCRTPGVAVDWGDAMLVGGCIGDYSLIVVNHCK